MGFSVVDVVVVVVVTVVSWVRKADEAIICQSLGLEVPKYLG